eukprot:Amastigsp_a842437_28.p4 type:complete len:108 gc:universal Amastigsp_a842437_28:653-330(-)
MTPSTSLCFWQTTRSFPLLMWSLEQQSTRRLLRATRALSSVFPALFLLAALRTESSLPGRARILATTPRARTPPLFPWISSLCISPTHSGSRLWTAAAPSLRSLSRM